MSLHLRWEKKLLLCGARPAVAALEPILARAEIEVDVVSTPAAVVERAAFGRPDVVVLDLSAAPVTALAACSALRAEPLTAHVPIVALVAAGADDLVESAYRRGCNDHLMQPLQPALVYEKLRDLLGIPLD